MLSALEQAAAIYAPGVMALSRHSEETEVSKRAAEIEAQGWEYWVRFFFPDSFSREFTKYQREFWEWGWQIAPDGYYRPRVECEPRGVGKSTNVQTWIVSLLARKRRRSIGYVSREAMKATQHYAAIKRKLENPKLLEYYPHLKPRVQVLRGAMEQWSSEAIVTEAGQMAVPISLLGSKRGFKSKDDVRFDVVILDDIDDLKESPELRAKNLELVKSDIIAAGTDITLFVFAQNLIHRDSICAQVLDHRADILSDRVFKGPFPLMKWYEADKEELPDGARQWKITAGESFDPAIPIAYSERLLNKFGKKTFDRECQQLTNLVDEENDFREWDEVYHIATRSEVIAGFAKYKQNLADEFGNLRWPDRFHKGKGLDWGTTKAHPSACIFATRPAETYAFSDIYFVFGEVVLPKYPYDAHVEAEVVSPGRVAKAIRDFMTKWHIRDFEYQRMSHEASAALNAFIIDMPDDLKVWFQKWKAQKGSGVPQTQRLLEIDKSKPHPFRCYPIGHPHEGEPLMGRPRIIFVVEDGQGELYVDDIGRLRVIGATNSEGLARLRYEIPIYNHRNQGDKKVDDDACLVAGTLIQTDKGQVPIEAIKVGHQVATRQGYRRVVKAGQTSASAEIWAVRLSNGKILLGTKNHPIYVQNKGFCRLDGLRGGDIIFSWRKETSLPIKGLTFIDTQNPKYGHIGITISHIYGRVKRAFRDFITRSGKTILAQYLRDITFTTKTIIRLIIDQTTWNASPVISIYQTMCLQADGLDHLKILSTWRESEIRPEIGTGAQRVGNGIVSIQKDSGLSARVIGNSASDVNPDITPHRCTGIASIALSRVKRKLAGRSVKEKGLVHAWLADQTSVAQFEPKTHGGFALQGAPIAIISVERVPDKQPVYNIAVEDVPEYFANGILVHNCDGLRGLLSVFAPSADAMDYEERVQATIPEGHRLDDQKELHPQGQWITPEAELDYAYNLTRAKQILANKGGSVQRFDRFGRRIQ